MLTVLTCCPLHETSVRLWTRWSIVRALEPRHSALQAGIQTSYLRGGVVVVRLAVAAQDLRPAGALDGSGADGHRGATTAASRRAASKVLGRAPRRIAGDGVVVVHLRGQQEPCWTSLRTNAAALSCVCQNRFAPGPARCGGRSRRPWPAPPWRQPPLQQTAPAPRSAPPPAAWPAPPAGALGAALRLKQMNECISAHWSEAPAEGTSPRCPNAHAPGKAIGWPGG